MMRLRAKVKIMLRTLYNKQQRALLQHHHKFWLNAEETCSSSLNSEEGITEITKKDVTVTLKNFEIKTELDRKIWEGIMPIAKTSNAMLEDPINLSEAERIHDHKPYVEERPNKKGKAQKVQSDPEAHDENVSMTSLRNPRSSQLTGRETNSPKGAQARPGGDNEEGKKDMDELWNLK